MGNYLASFLCKFSRFNIIKMKILKSLLIFVMRNKGRLAKIKGPVHFFKNINLFYFICICLHLSVYTHTYALHVYRYLWWREEDIRYPRTVLQMAMGHHVGTENGTQVLSKNCKCFQPLSYFPRCLVP